MDSNNTERNPALLSGDANAISNLSNNIDNSCTHTVDSHNVINNTYYNIVQKEEDKDEQKTVGKRSTLDKDERLFIVDVQEAIRDNHVTRELLETIWAMKDQLSNDRVSYFAGLLMAAMDEDRLVNYFERHCDEPDYWITFWAALAYATADNMEKSTSLLSLLGKWQYPSHNKTLLRQTITIRRSGIIAGKSETERRVEGCESCSEELEPLRQAILAACNDKVGRDFYSMKLLGLRPASSFVRNTTATPISEDIIEKSYASAQDMSKSGINTVGKTIEEALNSTIQEVIAPPPVHKKKTTLWIIALAALVLVLIMVVALSSRRKDGKSVAEPLESAIVEETPSSTPITHSAPSAATPEQNSPTPANKVSTTPSQAPGNMELGEKAYNSGKYAEARIYLEDAVSDGDPLAAYYLGLMYMSGKGVNTDLSKAFKYLQSAAEKECSKAYWPLAEMYRNGDGTEANVSIACKWYRKVVTNDKAHAAEAANYIELFSN